MKKPSPREKKNDMDKRFEAMTIKELEKELVSAIMETSAWERKTAEAEQKLWEAGEQVAHWRVKKNMLMWAIMTRKVELEGLKGQAGSPETLT
jgi:transcription elongation factor GreA-like protein